MKGRIGFAGMILLIIVLSGFVVTATSVQVNRITVDQNGNGDFMSIQEAIDNAEDGTIIFIKPGEYSEILNIKKQIQLIGEDKTNTIINPVSQKNKYAIRLGAPNIKIKDLTIINGASGLYSSGIRISSPNSEIENCNIHDVPVGISVFTSNNKITNCNFWNCKDEGIALIGSKTSECNNNIISTCIFHDNCDGVELQYSSNNIIENCEFFRNSHTGIDAIASSNNNNRISNCKIYENNVHGIYLSSSSKNKIINCSISKNGDGNIVVRGKSENNDVIENKKENNEANKSEFKELTVSNEETIKVLVEGLPVKNFLKRFFNLAFVGTFPQVQLAQILRKL